jgi:pantoate kinase
VRQETDRGREIAGLFREGRAADALAMKRADGTARLVGGDQDQVIDRIADLYIARRDVLRAAGSKLGVTVSALTNEDAADISRAIRTRMKERGELGAEERDFAAVDQRGMTYDLQLAPGDKVRLFRKTSATIDGKRGDIGSNGDVVEIVRWTAGGVVLRDKRGRDGEVQWQRLADMKSDRLLLAYGHALTVDSAQGITSGEHINALPRGTAGATSFKTYVAESRHVTQVHTLIAEAAVFEAVKMRRALGDVSEVTTKDLWDRVAEDMSTKLYKALGMDLANGTRRNREAGIGTFIQSEHLVEVAKGAGRKPGVETRARLREEADRKAVRSQLGALDEALARNGQAVTALGQEIETFLRTMRDQTADLARRGVKAAELRQAREAAAARPSFSPNPY